MLIVTAGVPEINMMETVCGSYVMQKARQSGGRDGERRR
jgi:hypothetical protein